MHIPTTALALLASALPLTTAHPLAPRDTSKYYPYPAFYSEVVKEYVSTSPGGTCTRWDIETVGVEAERRPRCRTWDKRLPSKDYLLRRVKTSGPLPCVNWKITESEDKVTVEPVCDIPANKKYRPYHHKSMGPKPIHPENPPKGKRGDEEGEREDGGEEEGLEKRMRPEKATQKGWRKMKHKMYRGKNEAGDKVENVKDDAKGKVTGKSRGGKDGEEEVMENGMGPRDKETRGLKHKVKETKHKIEGKKHGLGKGDEEEEEEHGGSGKKGKGKKGDKDKRGLKHKAKEMKHKATGKFRGGKDEEDEEDEHEGMGKKGKGKKGDKDKVRKA